MSTNGFDPVSIPVAQCGRDVIHADMIMSSCVCSSREFVIQIVVIDGACSRRLSVGTAASRTDQAPRIRDAWWALQKVMTNQSSAVIRILPYIRIATGPRVIRKYLGLRFYRFYIAGSGSAARGTDARTRRRRRPTDRGRFEVRGPSLDRTVLKGKSRPRRVETRISQFFITGDGDHDHTMRHARIRRGCPARPAPPRARLATRAAQRSSRIIVVLARYPVSDASVELSSIVLSAQSSPTMSRTRCDR